MCGGGRVHRKQCNVTTTCRQHCILLQQWRCDAVFYFLQRTTQQWPTVLFGEPDIALPSGNLDLSRTWFLGSHESVAETASQSVEPFLPGSRTWPTRGHTEIDHATPSVATGRIWLLLRCGLKLRERINNKADLLWRHTGNSPCRQS